MKRRFIPTHVGNTRSRLRLWHQCAVHPNARGEHGMKALLAAKARGSSPRTWGTRRKVRRRRTQRRFIPTHVGNTFLTAFRRSFLAVHPHARGEHRGRSREGAGRYGSSPRTWGTRGGEHLPAWKRRFIPTHVGNTPRWAKRRLPSTVHPHARGEHYGLVHSPPPIDGSSPRTWGTPPARPR